MKFLTFTLLIVSLFASEFIPKEFAPPPNTKPKDIPPPLTELAEKEGFSAHLAYTNKLNNDVKNIQAQDIQEAGDIVTGVQSLLKKTAAKAITANTRAQLEAEKVENDDGNTAAAGIYMEDKIKKVKADAATARDALDIVKQDADAKVAQAQKDVIAKNEIITQKSTEIDQLNDRLKQEGDRQQKMCDEKLETQSKAKDDQCASQVALKQDEVNSANQAKQQAEAGVEEAKAKCQSDLAAQKEASDQVVAQKEQQMESMKQDIANKDAVIAQKDTEKDDAVTKAQSDCAQEKEAVRAQTQQACEVEKSKLQAQVEAANADKEKANKEIAAVEARLTDEKDKAVADLQGQLTECNEAKSNEVRDAKAATNEECDKRLDALKQADAATLQTQRGLTSQALKDSKENMARKEEQCRSQEETIKGQIESKKKERDDMKVNLQNLRLAYNKLHSTVTAQLELSQKAQAANDNAIAGINTLEESVAAPLSQLKTNYSALAVYISLICSALFLSGLIFKLRGQAVKHQNYSAVLTDA